jgi:hypothetical protein
MTRTFAVLAMALMASAIFATAATEHANSAQIAFLAADLRIRQPIPRVMLNDPRIKLVSPKLR